MGVFGWWLEWGCFPNTLAEEPQTKIFSMYEGHGLLLQLVLPVLALVIHQASLESCIFMWPTSLETFLEDDGNTWVPFLEKVGASCSNPKLIIEELRSFWIGMGREKQEVMDCKEPWELIKVDVAVVFFVLCFFFLLPFPTGKFLRVPPAFQYLWQFLVVVITKLGLQTITPWTWEKLVRIFGHHFIRNAA